MSMYVLIAASGVLALLAAAGAGWWIAQRVLREHYETRVHRVVDMVRHQHATATDKLRAAHAAVQTELERQRTTMHRQVAVATVEARNAAARLEDQLRMAYAELDRLRMEVDGPSRRTARAELDDGFAVTQPWTSRL